MSPKPQVDTSKPHPARVYDYLLGGKDHYAVDKEVGERLPEAAKESARHNRAFMHRASAWVAGTGIDQFLDIGTGIPTEPNLHQIVQGVNPACRVVYTDNDPIVLRHAEALLISAPGGTTDYIDADVLDPGTILDHARTILDFDRPIGLSLIALLHFVKDEQGAYDIVRTLVGALVPGSALVLSHGTFDMHPELKEQVMDAYPASIPGQARDRAEVTRFFDGLDLVAPGLVTATEWYKGTPPPEPAVSGMYAGVGLVLP
jgi:hypothetical protein